MVMSQTRVSVEWLFNEIKTYFNFVSLKWQARIGRSSHRRCSINPSKSATLFLKKDSGTGVFLLILQNFWEHLFYRTPLDGCFWIGLSVAGKICSVRALLQNTGTCLFRTSESNFWVFPLHLLSLTCFSFYITCIKKRKYANICLFSNSP